MVFHLSSFFYLQFVLIGFVCQANYHRQVSPCSTPRDTVPRFESQRVECSGRKLNLSIVTRFHAIAMTSPSEKKRWCNVALYCNKPQYRITTTIPQAGTHAHSSLRTQLPAFAFLMAPINRRIRYLPPQHRLADGAKGGKEVGSPVLTHLCPLSASKWSCLHFFPSGRCY